VLGNYGKNLECHVRERYLKKISVVGVPGWRIFSGHTDRPVQPPIEVSDLLSYFVSETSYYTNKQFEAPEKFGGVKLDGFWFSVPVR